MMKRFSNTLFLVAAVLAYLFSPRSAFEPTVSAQSPGADALVAAYGFEEGLGATAADSSGKAHTGTLTNAAWSSAGRFGGALSFNGSNSWVTVNDSALLDLTTGMTLQAWVFPTALSGWRTAVLKERPGAFNYALYAHDNAPRPASYVNVGSGDIAATGTSQLPLNTWTHIATTYNGTTLTMYVNGALAGSRAVSGSMLTSSGPLRIGGNSIWGEYFSGRIDEVRVHNRALSQAEIQALMLMPIGAQAGFEIFAYNSTVTLGASDSGIFQMDLLPLGGFTGAVVPSVSGLPAGVTGTFEPVGGPPHPGPFALLVNSGPNALPGTYQITVTCVNGSLVATKALTLIVTGAPGFRVAAEPNSLLVAQGQAGIASFQVLPENGFAGFVSMGTSALPPGVSAAFTPASSIAVPGSGVVRFTVGGGATPGVYPLVITASDGLATRQASFTLTVLPAGGSGGSWRQQALGDTPALFYGVIVGDIGNTGQNRVIASGGAGLMYAYSFNGISWSSSQMPFNDPADVEMHNMAIGPGRNDGVNRLYIAAVGLGRVYEVSWVNGAWQVGIAATLTGATDVSVGYGRNDGVLRVYVTWMAGTTELTWTGSGWSQLTMSNNEGGWVHGLDLAPGRNDGVNRIYTANQGNGQVYEYSWNGAAWAKQFVGSSSDMRNIKVGEGRNDGLLRLYAASGDANIYEFTWTGTNWVRASMGNAGSGGVKVHSVPARTKPDTRVRIYAADSLGGVYEYNWTGSAWQTTALGQATAYMYGLDAGDGLNKGTVQVYGSSYDGNTYLYEWVPDGPPPLVTVPDVVGQTQAAAAASLSAVGLVIGTVTIESSLSVPVGQVMSQLPEGTTQVAPGSAVNLVVSSGVIVPDVVGRTVTDAETAIVTAGLILRNVTNAPSSTVAAGLVMSQTPAAGLQATGGSAVDLVVSTGPAPPVQVPPLAGLTQAQAAAALGAVDLVVGAVTTAPSGSVPAGLVISSDPATGVPVPAGSAVALVLSSGPPPVPVPNLVNRTQGQAAADLAAVGLLVGTVTNATSTTVAAGSVISHNPAAGVPAPVGSAVALVVSSGPPPAGIAVDKVVFSDGNGTRNTPLFSTTSPGEVLLAFAASDAPPSGANQTLIVSGAGLTWTLVRRSNSQRGTSEIWRAFAPNPLVNATVRSTQSRPGYHQSLTVVTFIGATGTGASAIASGATGAPSVSLTTTRAGSRVYGVGNDWDRAVARGLGPNQTMVHQWVDSGAGDTFWVQARSAAVTNANTSVQINNTSPTNDRWNLAAVEIVR